LNAIYLEEINKEKKEAKKKNLCGRLAGSLDQNRSERPGAGLWLARVRDMVSWPFGLLAFGPAAYGRG
jgi:hypothetical protein